MRVLTILFCVVLSGISGGAASSAWSLPGFGKSPKTIHLFNKRDLTGFYTYIKDRGRDSDPLHVFSVQKGMLRISGQEFGCVTSEKEFENYHLIVEFKWGDQTFAPRVENARDSGVLVHSVGADGAFGKTWMHSIECQLIEGGTGDIIVVGDGSEAFSVTSPAAPEWAGNCPVYQPGGKPVTLHKGRVNWFGRDPEWKDVKGFRGKRDVEKKVGKWNRYECIAEGDRMTVRLNGVVVNEGHNVKPCKGRIQIQSEGAELFVRRVDIIPLDPKSN